MGQNFLFIMVFWHANSTKLFKRDISLRFQIDVRINGVEKSAIVD